MSIERPEPEIDVRPLAAYVVGRHPYTLRLWQEGIWDAIRLGEVKQKAREYEMFLRETAELEGAIQTLVLHGQVNAAALVELHRAQDRLAAICRRMKPSRTGSGLKEPDVPGRREWLDLIAFARQAVGPSEELQLWRDLGDALGESLYCLKTLTADVDPGFVPPRVGDLHSIATSLNKQGRNRVWVHLVTHFQRLATKAPDPLPELPDWQPPPPGYYLSLGLLDMHLRASLAHQAADEPILVLDREHITFYGVTRSLEEYHDRQTELRCLWTLAEQAGKPLSRADLIKGAGIQTDPENLPPILSRLGNKILRPLAEEHARRNRCSLPAGYARGFVVPKKARYGGTYKLDLTTGQVRLIPPKPDWMSP